MKTNKSLFSLALSTLMLLPLVSCSHTHSPAPGWDRDAHEHWQVCECGESLNSAAHTLDDMGRCEICSSDIWDFGDGMFDVQTYNEHGDLIRSTSYESDGSISYDSVYEMGYDDNGNLVSRKILENGVLVSEEQYAQNADGEARVTQCIYYNEDGSKSISENNENGDTVLITSYDADGNKIFESIYEYALDKDGNSYETKDTSYHYDSGVMYISEYNEYGDQTSLAVCDLKGNVQQKNVFEREYNADGDPIWEKDYTDGVLVREITGYKTLETEDYFMRCPEKIIEYNEDGSKLVSIYGDNGEVATETYYTSSGTVERQLSYEYETDANGNWASIKVSENGKLVKLTEYSLDSDGWSYPSKVTEYDATGKVVSEIRYDADGNEIQ